MHESCFIAEGRSRFDESTSQRIEDSYDAVPNCSPRDVDGVVETSQQLRAGGGGFSVKSIESNIFRHPFVGGMLFRPSCDPPSTSAAIEWLALEKLTVDESEDQEGRRRSTGYIDSAGRWHKASYEERVGSGSNNAVTPIVDFQSVEQSPEWSMCAMDCVANSEGQV